ncbi:hypothetical protein LCGC14_2171700 [marine sediment metagenome]|uniref:Uncharacterized protein n=1 Tax=marine sediment metagenome TaxID=412755 RepID=A0A0F9EC52_9ZZZZ
MENDSSKQTKESAYNLNEANFLLIASLQQQAFNLSNKKRFNESFDRWQDIRILIEPRFETYERTKLDQLENNFKGPTKIKIPFNLSSCISMKDGLSNLDKYKIYHINKIKSFKLNRFVKYLMLLMRKYQISQTDKSKVTKLD